MKHTTCLSLLGALALPLFVGSAPANQRSIDEPPKGLAKSDWSSIRAAYEAGRHAFQAVDGGFQARNPGQQWTTKFEGRGFCVAPAGGGWEWGLELESYGFPGQERRHSRPTVVSADGQRLTLAWDGCLEEWLINDQRGLEHGFTVKERPPLDCGSLLPLSVSQPAAGQAGKVLPPSQAHPRQQAAAVQELCFTLGVRGGLRPEIAADAQAVSFLNEAGTTVLTYAGLKVWDADGKTLPSHFEAASNHSLRLVVDERGARYPITIDPIAQQAYLKPDGVVTSQALDLFGRSVAVSGDTVVVGAIWEDSSTLGVNSTPNELADSAGAAYVFVRNGTTWTQQAYLKPAAVGTSQAEDFFGWSVAISGDTVVVGAPREDSSTTGVNSTPNDDTGFSGAAYVFTRSGTSWTQQAYLKPADIGTSQAGDQFGISVAVAGDTVVVGAIWEDSSTLGVNSTPNDLGDNAGAAYVFVRSGATWTQQAYLKPADIGASQVGDQFGISVAVAGDTVVVGAYQEDSSTTGVNSMPNDSDVDANGLFDAGAAYVFVRSGGTWTQQAYLKPAAVGTSQAFDYFGYSVAVSGDTVVVGAYQEDSSTTGVNSTPNDTGGANFDAGAAYVFVRSGTTWTQQAYLKPADVGTTQAGDKFGYSVAVSGDTVVVGAIWETSSTTGVNSTPNDSAGQAGAAYVFVRSGATWTQQAYLKPATVGTTQAGDEFGYSVAVSGDTVVVGAYAEDSRTSGVNSTPNDDGGISFNSGAAYVFQRSGTTWTQQAYLKSAGVGTAQAGDNFGYSVAVSGDTVVVGAPGEDSSTTGVNSFPDAAATDSGAAYVFVRSGTTWTQQAYLKPAFIDGTQAGDDFGRSVAISGDIVVVGAPGEDSSSTGVNSFSDEDAAEAGAAYVFTRSGTTWVQHAYLKPDDVGTSQTGDDFGRSVAVSGGTVVVGASNEDSSTTGVNSSPEEAAFASGAAYVFVRNGPDWTQEAYLKPAAVGTSQEIDQFGWSVCVSGDSVVVGAPAENSSSTGVNSVIDESAARSGAAYVFVRSGTIWTQEAYLKPAAVGTTQAGDEFGYSVAVSGDTVVVGALFEDSSTTGVNGTPNEVADGAGAAFVFVRSGTSWTQQAWLKPAAFGTLQESDFFGASVGVSGDRVIVGAPFENSSTTGVNSTPNESASHAGAAYIFVRSGTSWTQQAYLKPAAVGTTQTGDWFGVSVAISGDTVAVGANREDSSAPGVNSNPNELAGDAGAAYVFNGFGSSLTPSQTWRQAQFGTSNNSGTAANDFDFEADGWKNLLEYALVTDPKANGETGITLGPRSFSGTEYLRSIFTRDPTRNDVTIRVEVASNMAGPWTTVATSINGATMSGAGLVSETDLGGGLKQVEVRDTVPTSTANPPRRFLRITVQE